MTTAIAPGAMSLLDTTAAAERPRLNLRPYQEEAITAVLAGRARGINRPLVVMATGTGKTVVFSELARRVAAEAGHAARVLILAHREELIDQAADKLRTVWPEARVGKVRGATDQPSAQVVVATIQTMDKARRRERYLSYGAPDLVIVDEAHHSGAMTYMRTLSALRCFSEGGPLCVGVTATPNPRDKDLAACWQEVVYSYGMADAVDDGYLCDLVGLRVEIAGLDLSAVKQSRGDYQDGALSEAMSAAQTPKVVAQTYAEHAVGRRAICFTPTVALAEEVAQEMNDAGFRAVMICGEHGTAERHAIYRALRRGELDMVCNAALLTEGFDEPSVDCVVIARPTRSRGLYVQMAGRGTRLSPGKTDCVVIDLVGVSSRVSLMGLGELLGVPAERMTGRVSMREERERIAAEKAQHQQREIEVQTTARKVQLLARMSWVRLDDRGWALRLPNGNIVAMMQVDTDDEESWRVGVIDNNGGPNIRLGGGLTVEYAQGMAEDFARNEGAGRLLSKDADWRRARPSGGQLAEAKRRGLEVPDGATRGEVAEMLDADSIRRHVANHRAKARRVAA